MQESPPPWTRAPDWQLRQGRAGGRSGKEKGLPDTDDGAVIIGGGEEGDQNKGDKW